MGEKIFERRNSQLIFVHVYEVPKQYYGILLYGSFAGGLLVFEVITCSEALLFIKRKIRK